LFLRTVDDTPGKWDRIEVFDYRDLALSHSSKRTAERLSRRLRLALTVHAPGRYFIT